jgi:hypothetical protein
MWRLQWIDKSGKPQSAIVGDKTKLEEIMDNLENAGVDISTFIVSHT